MEKVVMMLGSGVGSRLFPLCSEARPKQFSYLLDDDKTMVELTMNRFPERFEKYLVTLKDWERLVEDSGIDERSHIFYEPERRESGTSAIFGMLSLWKKKKENVIVIQTPSDHFIPDDEEFRKCIEEAVEIAEKQNRIVAIGVKPDYTETEYGYLVEEEGEIERFVQKPPLAIAERLIKKGALWNTAIYVYPLSLMINEVKWRLKPCYLRMLSYVNEGGKYQVPAFSFEQGLFFQLSGVKVVEWRGRWEDVGNVERWKRIRSEIDGREKNEVNS